MSTVGPIQVSTGHGPPSRDPTPAGSQQTGSCRPEQPATLENGASQFIHIKTREGPNHQGAGSGAGALSPVGTWKIFLSVRPPVVS